MKRSTIKQLTGEVFERYSHKYLVPTYLSIYVHTTEEIDQRTSAKSKTAEGKSKQYLGNDSS